MTSRKKLLAVSLASMAILFGLYLLMHAGQDPLRHELVGTWQRVANPTPPPGAPPIPEMLGDTLEIDNKQITWHHHEQAVNVPYSLTSNGDRLVMHADLDKDGQPDLMMVEILKGGEAPAFTLSFGSAYGCWKRAATP